MCADNRPVVDSLISAIKLLVQYTAASSFSFIVLPLHQFTLPLCPAAGVMLSGVQLFS